MILVLGEEIHRGRKTWVVELIGLYMYGLVRKTISYNCGHFLKVLDTVLSCACSVT